MNILNLSLVEKLKANNNINSNILTESTKKDESIFSGINKKEGFLLNSGLDKNTEQNKNIDFLIPTTSKKKETLNYLKIIKETDKAEKTDKTGNKPDKEAEKADQAKLKQALASESARVAAANRPILEQGLQNTLQKLNDGIVAEIIRARLNDDNPDIKNLIVIPDVKGINGGKGDFNIGKITEEKLDLFGFISDKAEVSITGHDGKTLKASAPAITTGVKDKSVDKTMVKKLVVAYFAKKGYLDRVKQMKPREMIVFESDPATGKPCVWAIKKGNLTIIKIEKAGLKLTLEFSGSEQDSVVSAGSQGVKN